MFFELNISSLRVRLYTFKKFWSNKKKKVPNGSYSNLPLGVLTPIKNVGQFKDLLRSID